MDGCFAFVGLRSQAGGSDFDGWWAWWCLYIGIRP